MDEKTSESSSDMLQRACELESSGKRNLLSENYIDAVADLSEACQILCEVHGDSSEKCAPIQYMYGTALLGLAREENAVIGGEGEGDASSDEENQEPTEEKQAENEGAVEYGEAGTSEPNPDESVNAEEEDEDVSNLQLAWEVLDLARNTFESQYTNGDAEAGRHLANTLKALGEVAMESDNYPQSVEDFQKCLDIQLKILADDDRAVSETHFNMGSAYSCIGDTTKAIEAYKYSVDVLERRLANLRKDVESSDKDDEAKKLIGEEIEELGKVIADIQERIEDTVEMKKEVKGTVDMLKPAVEKQVFSAVFGGDLTQFGETSSGFGEASSSFQNSPTAGSSSAKPLNVITSLKRKATKTDENVESGEKKTKTDSVAV